MKFENRILAKILAAFLFAWTLFLIFLYQNMYSNLMSDLRQQGQQSQEQLAILIHDTGASLLTISKNMSDLVFSANGQVSGYSIADLQVKLTQGWKIFGKQHPLLTMGYYDKNYQLLGSWGVDASRNQVYATPSGLLQAFEERVGINYFTCQDICYYHASRAFYPNSFEYGILHLSIPVDSILGKFKSLNTQNITLLQKGAGPDDVPITMFDERFFLQSTTRLLEFRTIQPFLIKISSQKIPYLFNEGGQTHFLYAFSFPKNPGMLYVLSSNVTAQLTDLRHTFSQIMLGSFSVLCLMLGVLHFSLHQIIFRLHRLIRVLPIIGEGRFKDAAGQLEGIAKATKKVDAKDELGLLHATTVSLNQQLEDLHHGYMRQNVQLRQLAEYDAMTGLYNRRKFQELMMALHAAQQPFFLVNFDLDHFKLVNDTLGHAVGDQLLVLFSAILKQHGKDTIIARMGGDEFAMIIEGDIRDQAYVRLSAINQQMERLKLNEATAAFLRCTPSIGLAHYPGDTENLDQLAAFADAAMYENKRRKQGVCVFYSGQEVSVAEEKQFSKWINLIFYAIQHDQLQPFFQPIITANKQEVVAFEALARLYGQHSLVSVADNFIAYAEQAQAIVQIDYVMLDRVLRKACQMCPQPCLMINISNITLERVDTRAYIMGKLQEYNYDPGCVVFELTESNEIKDFVGLRRLMVELRAIGIRFALDDFGVGYSSFNYISCLKFDFLKIDKSIINGLLRAQEADDHVSSLHIIESIVFIAEKSKIKTIAEGIESLDLLNKVLGFRIDLLQGYLFGKPAPELIHLPMQQAA